MGPIMFWLMLLIVFLVAEAITLGLTTIWFAGGALVALVASFLKAPVAVQIILFFAVSLLLLYFTRPIAVKYFNRDRVRTNVESLVGKKGIVTGEIDNLRSVGQVTVSGQEWSARSAADSKIIPQGAVVTIMAINGVKLIVREDTVPADAAAASKKEDADPADVQEAPEKEAGEPALPEEKTSEETE